MFQHRQLTAPDYNTRNSQLRAHVIGEWHCIYGCIIKVRLWANTDCLTLVGLRIKSIKATRNGFNIAYLPGREPAFYAYTVKSLTNQLHGTESFLRRQYYDQLVKKFASFYGTRRLIKVLAKNTRQIQSPPSKPVSPNINFNIYHRHYERYMLRRFHAHLIY